MVQQIVLQQFFYKPMSRFGVRDLSRKTRLDTKTIMKYLNELVSKGVVLKKVKKGSFPHYEANRLSLIYRFEKSHALISKIIATGLVDYLEITLRPKAIVLFGSVAKGTYHENSDIDIFVYGKYRRLDLKKYERKIGHRIQLLFEDDLKQLSMGLLENVYNGELLLGKVEVIK